MKYLSKTLLLIHVLLTVLNLQRDNITIDSLFKNTTMHTTYISYISIVSCRKILTQSWSLGYDMFIYQVKWTAYKNKIDWLPD